MSTNAYTELAGTQTDAEHNERTSKLAALSRNQLLSGDHLDQTWQEIAEKFREAAEDETLDIYQMCAWVAMLPPNEIVSSYKRWFYYWKAFICALIQGPGQCVFLFVILGQMLSSDGKGVCAMLLEDEHRASEEYSVEIKILSGLFALYISAKMGGQIQDIGRRGLYNMNFFSGKNCPPFCSRFWVYLGGYINVNFIHSVYK